MCNNQKLSPEQLYKLLGIDACKLQFEYEFNEEDLKKLEKQEGAP